MGAGLDRKHRWPNAKRRTSADGYGLYRACVRGQLEDEEREFKTPVAVSALIMRP